LLKLRRVLKNKLFIGLAANQLISSRLNKLNSVPLITTGNKLIRHYNLSAAYLTKVNNNISLEPYAMLRTTFITSPQVELGAKMTYNDFVFGGLSYRGKDAVIGLIGLNYKQFTLAYSYDFTTSGIRNYSSGSHEILLAYQFNKKSKTPEIIMEQPKDSDGDGVSDNEDLCPNVKGLREYKGCPDSDGDGVFDDLDECKTVKGPKENKGCPWPDSDNDGLSDNKDDCPTISGPIENRGCPYGDTDGDGVNDNVDPCPKTAGPIENKGCPVIEKKDQEVIDMAVKNLEFETSKDIIEESSKPSLNTLADKLKQKGEWNLLLSGHTDNVGDDDANMILSKNRAEAVKNYFISKGISENRIKVNYFGETKPIADNSTPDGRQKNRRVEFVIVFE
jgi:outer membrane protein OmpA-like peptidoglycan-associated protein